MRRGAPSRSRVVGLRRRARRLRGRTRTTSARRLPARPTFRGEPTAASESLSPTCRGGRSSTTRCSSALVARGAREQPRPRGRRRRASSRRATSSASRARELLPAARLRGRRVAATARRSANAGASGAARGHDFLGAARTSPGRSTSGAASAARPRPRAPRCSPTEAFRRGVRALARVAASRRPTSSCSSSTASSRSPTRACESFSETLRPLRAPVRGRRRHRSSTRARRGGARARPRPRSPTLERADRRQGERAHRAARPHRRARSRAAQPLAEQPLPPEVPPGLPVAAARAPARPARRPSRTSSRANAEIGVALANFFPRIGLTALLRRPERRALASSSTPAPASGPSRGSALGPIFTGRPHLEHPAQAAQAEREAATARVRADACSSRCAEVSDALIAREKLAAARASTGARGRRAARVGATLALRYSGGLATYFEVLDAQQQLFPAETGSRRSQRDQLLARGRSSTARSAAAGPSTRCRWPPSRRRRQPLR